MQPQRAKSSHPATDGRAARAAKEEREGNELERKKSLLEEVNSDERARILIAHETLQVESFDVGIPIRVFGSCSSSSMTSPLTTTTPSDAGAGAGTGVGSKGGGSGGGGEPGDLLESEGLIV